MDSKKPLLLRPFVCTFFFSFPFRVFFLLIKSAKHLNLIFSAEIRSGKNEADARWTREKKNAGRKKGEQGTANSYAAMTNEQKEGEFSDVKTRI